MRSAIPADTAVAALDLPQDVDHRLRGRGSHPDPPLALELVGCLRDPGRAEVTQVVPAQSVVCADRLQVDADEAEQERGDEARAVLAAEAVDDDGPVLGRVGDGRDRLGEPGPAPLEELEVDRAYGAERVRLRVPDRVDLAPL